jgi:hypothetical protein
VTIYANGPRLDSGRQRSKRRDAANSMTRGPLMKSMVSLQPRKPVVRLAVVLAAMIAGVLTTQTTPATALTGLTGTQLIVADETSSRGVASGIQDYLDRADGAMADAILAAGVAGLMFDYLTDAQARDIDAALPYLPGRTPVYRSMAHSGGVVSVSDHYDDAIGVAQTLQLVDMQGFHLEGYDLTMVQGELTSTEFVGVLTSGDLPAVNLSVAREDCITAVQGWCNVAEAVAFALVETGACGMVVGTPAVIACGAAIAGSYFTWDNVCESFLCPSAEREMFYQRALCDQGACISHVTTVDRETFRRPNYAVLYHIYQNKASELVVYSNQTIPTGGCDPTGIVCQYHWTDHFGSSSFKKAANSVYFITYANWGQYSSTEEWTNSIWFKAY